MWMFIGASLRLCSDCALDRPDDAGVRAAAAEVVGERLFDLRFGRLLVLGEERGGFHDHAVDAVAALHGLLVDEGPLHRMWLLRCAEALQRHDPLPGLDRRQRGDAGLRTALAVDVHRASAALREPAAEARPLEREIVAQVHRAAACPGRRS